MQTPDLSGMPRQRHNGPLAVRLDVPHADRFVVRAAHNPARVKLHAGHPARVTLEGAHMVCVLEEINPIAVDPLVPVLVGSLLALAPAAAPP